MPKIFQSVKGTKDLLPAESTHWRSLETILHDFLNRWGYREIRTPVFEQTELFARSVGEDSEIVSKQMYTFCDLSETSLTLKPELTAPVMRAYIQHNLARTGALTKLYYIDSLFRQERPQAGRLRQFHQYGVEAIGSPYPEQDVEIITLAYKLLQTAGIEEMTLHLNSIGSKECRIRYRQVLINYLTPHKDKLSFTSQGKLETNPLRILDSKDPEDLAIIRNAPNILGCLEKEDRDHYETVLGHLTDLDIPFVQTHSLVRGLDYYSRTTFEITHPDLGAQNALCGGGRYDGLIEDLGGSPTPAVGFAAGIERILLALEKSKTAPIVFPDGVYLVAACDDARSTIIKLVADLRDRDVSADFDTLRRSLKSQMREANRLNCTHAIIIGEDELQGETVQVKNLTTGEQKNVRITELVTYIQRQSIFQ